MVWWCGSSVGGVDVVLVDCTVGRPCLRCAVLPSNHASLGNGRSMENKRP